MGELKVPLGAMALQETPEHTFKGAGKWFRTEALAKRYAERSSLLRRAKRAGFGNSEEELEKFQAAEEARNDALREARERKERERAERDRFRAEHGLHPKAHITMAMISEKAREDSRKYLLQANRARMNDSERLDSIRKLYRQRTKMSQTDLLLQIGRLVGEL